MDRDTLRHHYYRAHTAFLRARGRKKENTAPYHEKKKADEE